MKTRRAFLASEHWLYLKLVQLLPLAVGDVPCKLTKFAYYFNTSFAQNLREYFDGALEL